MAAADEHHFIGIWALLFVVLVSLAIYLGHLIRKVSPAAITQLLYSGCIH
jgi:hypothetical protein